MPELEGGGACVIRGTWFCFVWLEVVEVVDGAADKLEGEPLRECQSSVLGVFNILYIISWLNEASFNNYTHKYSGINNYCL